MDIEEFKEQVRQQNAAARSREGLAYTLDLHSPTGGLDFKRVLNWCVDVLERMPEEACDALFADGLFVSWCDPDASTADAWYSPLADSRHPFVFLAANLPTYGEEAARGVIAHEFAHIVCRHWEHGGPEKEDEADALARTWGFEREIEAMHEEGNRPAK